MVDRLQTIYDEAKLAYADVEFAWESSGDFSDERTKLNAALNLLRDIGNELLALKHDAECNDEYRRGRWISIVGRSKPTGLRKGGIYLVRTKGGFSAVVKYEGDMRFKCGKMYLNDVTHFCWLPKM